MAIAVLGLIPNPTVQATYNPPLSRPDLGSDVTIFTGTVECVFKGAAGEVNRDTLSFNLRDPNNELTDLRVDIDGFRGSAASIALASVAFDGTVSGALWAVDEASAELVSLDAGTGTASVGVTANLAVRGAAGVILRVTYTVFVRTHPGQIVVIP